MNFPICKEKQDVDLIRSSNFSDLFFRSEALCIYRNGTIVLHCVQACSCREVMNWMRQKHFQKKYLYSFVEVGVRI